MAQLLINRLTTASRQRLFPRVQARHIQRQVAGPGVARPQLRPHPAALRAVGPGYLLRQSR